MTMLQSKALWLPGIALALSLGLLACSSTNTPVGTSQDAGLPEDAGRSIDAQPDAQPPDVCGDGIVGDSESCDDGSEDSDDGCSADCQSIETGYECSGQPSVCAPVCGDGQIIAPEECDDANADANDGCSDACLVEPGFTCPTEGATCVAFDGSCALPFDLLLVDNAGILEGSANGTTAGGTNDVAQASCDGGLSGDGNDLVYAFTLPDARDVTITSTFAADGLLRVLGAPCDPTAHVPGEIGFGDACANQQGALGSETLTLLSLAPGTYFIAVDGVTNLDNNTFGITLSAVATTCGDGALDGTEECDDMNAVDGDGCSQCVFDPQFTCVGVPSICTSTCQDGVVDVDQLEQCDDGNNVNGDRCSDGCLLEFNVLDAEPNNSSANAQPVASGETIVGAVPAGDFDVFELVLMADAWVTLEGYTTVDGDPTNYGGSGQLGPVLDCNFSPNEIDIDLHLFDAAGDVTDVATALISDDSAGVELCPFIGVNEDGLATLLTAGTYFIRVDAFDETLNVVQYAVDVRTDAPLEIGDACDDIYDQCLAPLLGCDSATLLCEELCGDGIVDTLEECDDGNPVEDDRCSNSCLLNADVVDNANNDTALTAQPLSSGEIARGSLDPTSTDPFDIYTFTVADRSLAIIESYTTIDGDAGNYSGEGLDTSLDCDNDTEIRLFAITGDPTDDSTALVRDDDDGDGVCSYLGPNRDGIGVLLTPGTYFIKVNEFGNNRAIPLYALDLQIVAPLQPGAPCDVDFDLCDPEISTCDINAATCTFPPPDPIDRSNFELFSTDFDLQNTALVFTPGGGTYGVIASSTASYPDLPGTGTIATNSLALADDDSTEVLLPFPFPFHGVDETSVFVGSNGYLTFGVGDIARTESTSIHFDTPRISFFFDDLNPSAGGTITVDSFPDRMAITFDDVPAFASSNTIQAQVQLFVGGTITISYLSVGETDGLVGISAGDNEGNPPAELDFSVQIPVVPAQGDLIINEFLANALGADSNCDGNASSTQDEFVELVNFAGVPLDLTGLTIADGNSVRHVFGASILAHGQAVVVYGGGTPSCSDIQGIAASSGGLGLNNGGDSITLSTGDSVSYASSTAAISSTLDVDLIGPDFVDHDQARGSAGDFSPGFRATGAAF